MTTWYTTHPLSAPAQTHLRPFHGKSRPPHRTMPPPVSGAPCVAHENCRGSRKQLPPLLLLDVVHFHVAASHSPHPMHHTAPCHVMPCHPRVFASPSRGLASGHTQPLISSAFLHIPALCIPHTCVWSYHCGHTTLSNRVIIIMHVVHDIRSPL